LAHRERVRAGPGGAAARVGPRQPGQPGRVAPWTRWGPGPGGGGRGSRELGGREPGGSRKAWVRAGAGPGSARGWGRGAGLALGRRRAGAEAKARDPRPGVGRGPERPPGANGARGPACRHRPSRLCPPPTTRRIFASCLASLAWTTGRPITQSKVNARAVPEAARRKAIK
jgi:hypothetical protein